MQRGPFFEDKNLDRDQTATGTNMEEPGPRKLAYSERSKEIDQSRIKAWSQRCRLGTGGVHSERILTFRTRDMDVPAPTKPLDLEVITTLHLFNLPSCEISKSFPKTNPVRLG